jgi:hypothetical protein
MDIHCHFFLELRSTQFKNTAEFAAFDNITSADCRSQLARKLMTTHSGCTRCDSEDLKPVVTKEILIELLAVRRLVETFLYAHNQDNRADEEDYGRMPYGKLIQLGIPRETGHGMP